MKNIFKKLSFAAFFLIGVLLLNSCKEDEYYIDGGKADSEYNGTILDYLKSKPLYFDTLTTVIKLAGLEKEFSDKEMTFFAPMDNSFRTLILNVNSTLFQVGKDTVKTLEEIEPAIWKKYLSMYMFKGSNRVIDYPQVDPGAKAMFPGQNYKSLSEDILNIGVFYNDVVTRKDGQETSRIKYAGYRQLYLSYIPNPAQPFDNWNTTRVSSSDIKPKNGVVHVLIANHSFGFDVSNFVQDVRLTR